MITYLLYYILGVWITFLGIIAWSWIDTSAQHVRGLHAILASITWPVTVPVLILVRVWDGCCLVFWKTLCWIDDFYDRCRRRS